jgi:hypothetical protein
MPGLITRRKSLRKITVTHLPDGHLRLPFVELHRRSLYLSPSLRPPNEIVFIEAIKTKGFLHDIDQPAAGHIQAQRTL